MKANQSVGPMNRRTRYKDCIAVSLLVMCGVFLTACHRKPSPAPPNTTFAADVLATVEGQAILLADYQTEVERRAHGRRERFANAGAKEELLDELVKSEALYVRAKQAGFDQRPDVARQIKQFIIHRFIEEQEKPEAQPVSDTEIAEYYRDHAARYATPVKVRFAVVQFGYSPKATEAKKQEVLQKAATALAEARLSRAADSTFGALAQRHSEDQATRYGGGDAGWVARHESSRWPSSVIEAAFALNQRGEFAPVITTSEACYLVKLIERKEAGHRPLEEVA